MSSELIAELREIVRKRADCLRVQEAAAISEAADLLSSLALAERADLRRADSERQRVPLVRGRVQRSRRRVRVVPANRKEHAAAAGPEAPSVAQE